MKPNRLFWLLSIGALFVAACGPGSPAGEGGDDVAEPTLDPDAPVSSDDPLPTAAAGGDEAGDRVIDKAPVDSIDILILESFPVQVRILVSGNLPDGCTEISHAEQTNLDNKQIMLAVFTKRPAAAVCTLALVPFEQSFPLDVYDFPAGDYTVAVNGVTATFNLAVDNSPQDTGDVSDPTSADDTIDLPVIPDDKEMIVGHAMVDSFDVVVILSFPVRYSVAVAGDLPDGCTEISHAKQTNLDNNQIVLEVFTQRPAAAMCTMALVPFFETFPLDVSGLPAGTYTLVVNEVSGMLTLDADQ